jgi:hypothetical protein
MMSGSFALYQRGNRIRYALERRLVGSRAGLNDEKKRKILRF